MNDEQRIASYGGTMKFDGTVLGLTGPQSRRRTQKLNRSRELAELGLSHPGHIQRIDPQHPDVNEDGTPKGSYLPVNCPACRPGHAPGTVSV